MSSTHNKTKKNNLKKCQNKCFFINYSKINTVIFATSQNYKELAYNASLCYEQAVNTATSGLEGQTVFYYIDIYYYYYTRQSFFSVLRQQKKSRVSPGWIETAGKAVHRFCLFFLLAATRGRHTSLPLLLFLFSPAGVLQR